MPIFASEEVYNVDVQKDRAIINLNFEEEYIAKENDFQVKKTIYKGDVNVNLYEEYIYNITVIDKAYECNCKEVIAEKQNVTLKTLSETICETCYTYKNEEKTGLRIAKEGSLIYKGKNLLEIAVPYKIEKLDGGRWGYSVWTDVYIMDVNIEGATWWNESWDYKREIIINSNEARTEFQTRIYINTTELYESGKLNADCSDIRFTNSSGYILPHFTDSCIVNNNATTSMFTVLTPLILGNTTIEVYYNNSGATDQSSFSSVFGNYLYSYSPFNGVTSDLSGNETATQTQASLTVDKDSIPNSAYDFDGINDNINFTYSVYSNEFTWCIWFNRDVAGTQHRLINRDDGSSHRCSYIVLYDTNYYGIQIRDSSGTWHGSTNLVAPTGIWTHLCVAHNSTNTEVYINGTQQSTTFSNGEAFTYSTDMNCPHQLGTRLASTDPFNGKMDEYRIYYGSALTATDIEKFYMEKNPTFTIGAEEDNLPDLPIIININKREIIFPSRLIIYTKVNQLTT